MKKTLILMLSVVVVLAFTSCQKQPTAAFTASKTNAEVGENIVFTNSSKDATKYEWNFGDGNVSSAETAMHSYTTAGTYIVKLKALSKNGKKSDEATSILTVTAPASAGLSYNNNSYPVNSVVIQYWGDYYSMGNGNYDVLLLGPGITFSGGSFSGAGTLLYLEMLSLQSSLVSSDYTYTPSNTYATYTFTSGSGLFINYDFNTGTADSNVSFSSGSVNVDASGTQYTFTCNINTSDSNTLTGGYSGPVTFEDNSKKAVALKGIIN